MAPGRAFSRLQAMHGPADSLLALACLAIVPFLVGRAIDPSIGWPARAWAGAVSVGMIILSGHALRLPPILTLGVAALVGIVSLLVSRREPDQAAPLSPREKRLLATLLVLLVPPTASAVLLALHGPVPEGDGLVLWYAKTRGAFFWDSISSGPLPAYPELGPVLWMLPLRVVGLEYENLGRALLPLVWCGWGISLLGVPGRPLDLPALAGAGLASLLVLDPVGLTNGYQDALVLLTAGFAAATMVRFLLRADAWPTRSALLATGMLTGSTALVKQEGMMWSLILGITFLVAILGPLDAGQPARYRSGGRAVRRNLDLLLGPLASAPVVDRGRRGVAGRSLHDRLDSPIPGSARSLERRPAVLRGLLRLARPATAGLSRRIGRGGRLHPGLPKDHRLALDGPRAPSGLRAFGLPFHAPGSGLAPSDRLRPPRWTG